MRDVLDFRQWNIVEYFKSVTQPRERSNYGTNAERKGDKKKIVETDKFSSITIYQIARKISNVIL